MLSQKEVEHIARLAHLRLSPEELSRMREQLSVILDYMQILREVDTSAVPPTAQILPLENITRPDQATPSIPSDEALANAPQRDAGFFAVPKVLDQDSGA